MKQLPNLVPLGLFLGITEETCLAQPHAASAKVVQVALDDAVLLHAPFQPQAVAAGPGDLALPEGAVLRPTAKMAAVHRKAARALAVYRAGSRHGPVGVLKGKALKRRCSTACRPSAHPPDAATFPVAAQLLPPWSCPRPAAG